MLFFSFLYNAEAFSDGAMADRLCRSLQSFVVRFDSGWCLHYRKNIRSHSSVGLERLPAKEEVAGSSPAGCTISFIIKLSTISFTVSGEFFRFVACCINFVLLDNEEQQLNKKMFSLLEDPIESFQEHFEKAVFLF